MKSLFHAMIVLGCAAVAADPCQAQAPSAVLSIMPRAGVLAPQKRLSEGAELGSSLAFGLAVELTLPLLPLGIRIGADHALDAPIESPTLDSELGEARVTAAVADLVVRPPSIGSAYPYLLAGAGLRRYQLDFHDSGVDQTTTDFAYHLGVGVDLRLRGFALSAEAGDYISAFQPADRREIQHDIVLMLGVRLGLLGPWL